MKLYGSKNEETSAFVDRTPVVHSSKSYVKKVLGAAGIGMFVACSLVAFQSLKEPTAVDMENVDKEQVIPLNLEANDLFSVNAVRAGARFMMRSPNKNNLCVDDGGGRSSGASKFHLFTCSPDNENQIFVYDSKLKQIRIPSKNLCMDDGGGRSSGESKIHLHACDPNNQNQWFEYDDYWMMLRNPSKNNLCVDDGGAQRSAETKFHLVTCDTNNINQRFEFLLLPGHQKPAIPSILSTSVEFLIQMSGKPNLCVDDGGATSSSNGAIKFRSQWCDRNSPNQIFEYNIHTYQLHMARKNGLCVYDGGGRTYADQTLYYLKQCDSKDPGQMWMYDPSTQMLRNPVKENMCMDDGGGIWPDQTPLKPWQCNQYSSNQHFIIQPRYTFQVYDVPDILKTGNEFLIQVNRKNNLCVDDGGATSASNGAIKFSSFSCDPSNPNQLFVYNPNTYQLLSSRKDGHLCINDGGALDTNGQTPYYLSVCESGNIHQRWVYDAHTQMFRNPAKINICMDDGGGAEPRQTYYKPRTCDVNSDNQHFSVVFPSNFRYPVPEILKTGEEFLIKVSKKNNLCVDDGGATSASNGAIKFSSNTCDRNSANQIFVYNPETYQLRSSRKDGNLCVYDGGAENNAGQTPYFLQPCDPKNTGQLWIYDASTQMFRNPVKNNMCMDDGGASFPRQTTYKPWTCDVNNINQHFSIVFPSNSNHPETTAPDTDAPLTDAPHIDILTEAPDSSEPTAGSLEDFNGNSAKPIEDPIFNPQDMNNDVTGDLDSTGMSGNNDASNPTIVPSDTEYIDPSGIDPLHPTDPDVQNPTFDISMFNTTGDWNLLASSKHTVGLVNSDNSDTISSNEIYHYLATIKHNAELKYATTVFKYERTLTCVTAGLKALSKDAINEDEYHGLVLWMYTHCAVGNDVPSSTLSPDSGDTTPIDRKYMTKQEFYEEIKNHFMNDRDTWFGEAQAANLRSEMAKAKENGLLSCITEASEKFGRYTEYERDEHFQSAVKWIQEECLSS